MSGRSTSRKRTVRLHGDLDMFCVDVVRAEIDTALAHASTVVVDLRDVAFVDSSTLGVFVTAHARALAAGVSVLFVIPPDAAIRRALRLAGLDRVLTLADGDESGLIGRQPQEER